MIICPHCQFENNDTNQSCQKCGTSLTHKNCHDCGTKVLYGTEKCPSCGAVTGDYWWVVITQKLEEEKESVVGDLFYFGKYLDEDKRYRLLSNSLKEIGNNTSQKILQAQVFDCHPLRKSKLDTLLEQLEEQTTDSGELKVLWNRLGIPPLALPYLTLVEEFDPTIPELFDAWQDKDRDVVLLPDRSFYESFIKFWQQENFEKPQVIDYLDQLAKLWQGLSTVKYCQSLLVESNLLVDEEQNLCLQQLIPDPTETDISLKDLGKLWHKLLNNSGKNFEGFLDSLLDKMAKGEIETAKQLRSQLQGLPQEPNLESLESIDENAIPDVPQSEDAEDMPTAFDGNNEEEEEEEEEEEDPEQTVVARSPDDLSTLMLPVQILSLSDAASSDIGRQRMQNEDYFGVQTQTHKQQSPQGTKYRARGLYIVCDGMGGHSAGEVASAMGVQLLQRYFKTNWRDALPDKRAIREGIIQANNTIYKVNSEKGKSGNKRMGTTLILALVEDTKVAIAHVGDSRIYSITRRFGLQRLTRDHCVAQMEIKRGVPAETAYARPDAYQLTQALGPRDGHLVEPDISFLDVKEDTLLLLCSDGLYDNEFVENHWQSHITPLLSGKEDLEQGVIKLVGFANQYNGHDNITGVLVRIKIQPDLSKKLRS